VGFGRPPKRTGGQGPRFCVGGTLKKNKMKKEKKCRIEKKGTARTRARCGITRQTIGGGGDFNKQLRGAGLGEKKWLGTKGMHVRKGEGHLRGRKGEFENVVSQKCRAKKKKKGSVKHKSRL